MVVFDLNHAIITPRPAKCCCPDLAGLSCSKPHASRMKVEPLDNVGRYYEMNKFLDDVDPTGGNPRKN